jgi:hypothetical protein
MKALIASLPLLTAALLASPAAAEVAGDWRVDGDISGVPFALDCRFAPHGPELGGVCVEAATGDARVKAGRAHPLTRGAVNGGQVSWAYKASFLVAKFDVNFAGRLDGDHMAGTTEASGRKGHFTAVRK